MSALFIDPPPAVHAVDKTVDCFCAPRKSRGCRIYDAITVRVFKVGLAERMKEP